VKQNSIINKFWTLLINSSGIDIWWIKNKMDKYNKGVTPTTNDLKRANQIWNDNNNKLNKN